MIPPWHANTASLWQTELCYATVAPQAMHNSNFKKSKPFTFLMDAAMLGYDVCLRNRSGYVGV